MWVWVLKDKKKQMVRMFYKEGAYPHASVFYSEEDAEKAAEHFGGLWSCEKV